MSGASPEKTYVEDPFIDQLVGLGWKHGRGDEDVAYLTGRKTFREVLLKDRLRHAIRSINVGEDGEPWMDDARVESAVSALERIPGSLLEANEAATRLLVKGAVVEGDPDLHGGHNQAVRYIDFVHSERNDFLVVDQFRVDAAGRESIIPDLVLFVNGIPLVVVECKSPDITDPMEAGINQLLRYTNNRSWVEEDEGVERLFHYNQFMVSTHFYEARAGTVGADPEHYLEWKDTSPVPMEEVARNLGLESPKALESQQKLAAGMLPHRTQSSTLHANLRRALPNAAWIGFTGTPIMSKDRKSTEKIFGPVIDRYGIKESEDDGSTVPILYEGRTTDAALADGRSMDELFEDMFRDRTPEELEALKRKYATEGDVLEADKLIAAKAADMLRHYVEAVLPNGLKAQVVATSRLAAVRYQKALADAHETLLADLDGLGPALLTLSEEEQERSDPETRFLVRAHAHLETIRHLEFAAVISSDHNDPPSWAGWTAEARRAGHVARFKKPLVHDAPEKRDGLAFLCVKNMLLTGFDAPVEGVLYLDRSMRGHELLQAIARVNRTRQGKEAGLVVDYYGVTRHLDHALKDYNRKDVGGAIKSLADELPKLEARHRRVIAVFTGRGLEVSDTPACVDLLGDAEVRADFTAKLKQFARSLDTVLPRPEALPYVADAKKLGLINKMAANRYRDGQLNVLGAGQKVRDLIDDHLEASGIDPKVPPISITDPNFAQVVEGRGSNRAKASEMEHAARHHISVHFREDPARYRKLSERLEQILETLEGRWEELVEALRLFTEDVRAGRPADDTGLDPKTQAPFLGILADQGEGGRELQSLASLTVEMVAMIRRQTCTVDFWRNSYKQDGLRGDLVEFLDDNGLVPFDKQEAVADEIAELAKALHTSLCPS